MTLIQHVKGGLRSFMLEISLWMMFHGRIDQLKMTEIKLRHSTRTINMWERADILKIYKSMKLLVKMKNVSFILWKKPHTDFWPTLTQNLIILQCTLSYHE